MNYTDFEFDEALKQRLDSLYSQNRQPHAIVIEGADAEKCKGLATFLTMRAVCRAENKPCGKCEQCIKARERCTLTFTMPNLKRNRRFIPLSKCEILLKTQVFARMRRI